MARTNVPLTALAANAGTEQAAGTTADPTNDHVIPALGNTEHLLIRFANTAGADHTATIKAGVGESAGQGDLPAITVPATTGVMLVAGLESARFMQADGSIYVDLDTGFAGTVTAYRLPRSA